MPAFGARHPRFEDSSDVKYIDISRARTRAEPIQSIPYPIVAYSSLDGDDNRTTRRDHVAEARSDMAD